MSLSSSQLVPEPSPSRVITRLDAPAPGATLICVAALHGNEPAGVHAVQRVAQRLSAAAGALRRGSFWGLIGNLPALAAERRYVDRDLNRGWNRRWEDPEEPAAVEDHEQREAWEAIEFARRQGNGPTFLLDLHTTSGRGRPFTVFADTLACRRFALSLPCPIILGLEEHLDGTLIDYAAGRRLVSIAVEGGQHEDSRSIDALESAIWLAMRFSRMIVRLEEVVRGIALLKDARRGLPRAVEVRARHAIAPTDGFRMHQGFSSFDVVKSGQLLAADRGGEIQAPQGGFVLMPLYQDQGDDGFFIVTTVRGFWLVLSRWLRTVRADRIAHWLPGVRRERGTPQHLLVNRRVARWFALEVLHLLGFRRLGEDRGILRVTKRHQDE